MAFRLVVMKLIMAPTNATKPTTITAMEEALSKPSSAAMEKPTMIKAPAIMTSALRPSAGADFGYPYSPMKSKVSRSIAKVYFFVGFSLRVNRRRKNAIPQVGRLMSVIRCDPERSDSQKHHLLYLGVSKSPDGNKGRGDTS